MHRRLTTISDANSIPGEITRRKKVRVPTQRMPQLQSEILVPNNRFRIQAASVPR